MSDRKTAGKGDTKHTAGQRTTRDAPPPPRTQQPSKGPKSPK